MYKVYVEYQGKEMEGRWENNSVVLDGGVTLAEEEATFLPPVKPTKIIAMHLNFPSRVKAFKAQPPRWPSYFLKPVSSLSAHRRKVYRPKGTKYLNYEGEIAVIIGQRAKNVKRKDAWEYIAGYTAANDYGLHDFRTSDRGSMFRVKGQDGFGPLGPYIIPADEVDPLNMTLKTYVNGKLVQEGNTRELMFPFDYLIEDITRLITLEPGDVILTGCPANSRPLEPGDVVDVVVNDHCRLTNFIEEREVDFGEIGAQPEDSDDAYNTAYEIK